MTEISTKFHGNFTSDLYGISRDILPVISPATPVFGGSAGTEISAKFPRNFVEKSTLGMKVAALQMST